MPNNLFALLARYRVVIPGIQRHYVQGANNPKAESVRKQFVEGIFNAIETNSVFNMHFIYGPINTDGEDSFVPVDGQQRLTTLWLIARYAAERSDPETRAGVLTLLSRFTYEDRLNAKRFCQALTRNDSKWNKDQDQDPNPNILCQNWFLDYWKEDETVASMIRMLSTIHNEWQNRKNIITGEQVLEAIGDKITFGLEIDSFGDDIYMKMNARGLQLTQWENFKCKFSESLPGYKDWDKDMEVLSNQYFECSGEKHELPDNSFFALYARVMAFEKEGLNKQCGGSIKLLANFVHDTWQQIELPFVPYTDFSIDADKAENVARTCVIMLKVVLKNYQKKVPYFGSRTLFETFFHPKNNNDLDFTLCCYEYFKEFNDVDCKDFVQALRLIWNILENVGRPSDNIHNRVDFVKKFIEIGDKSLYSSQSKDNIKDCPDQVEEEVEKATKMHGVDQSKPSDWNEGKLGKWQNWRCAIELAENFAFFKGAIRFLYRNAQGEATWENFATKLCNSMELFDREGLQEDKREKANNALISHCERLEDLRRKPVFDAGKESWKRILIDSSISGCVNSLLLKPNDISDNSDEVIRTLIDDTVWKNLIKETSGYELEWRCASPSLWLNRHLYKTLKLTRNNREDILDAFIDNPDVEFEKKDKDLYLQIHGVNYYYAVPVFFKYRYNGKEYRFAWQTWGWIDMYCDDNRLYDLYFKKYEQGFTIEIENGKNYEFYINQIVTCINSYEKFREEHNEIISE